MRARYCFEVKQEIATPVDVHAESEQEARECVLRRDSRVNFYNTEYGDIRLVLLRTLDE